MEEAKAPAQVAAMQTVTGAVGMASKIPGRVGIREMTTKREMVNRLTTLAVRLSSPASEFLWLLPLTQIHYSMAWLVATVLPAAATAPSMSTPPTLFPPAKLRD